MDGIPGLEVVLEFENIFSQIATQSDLGKTLGIIIEEVFSQSKSSNPELMYWINDKGETFASVQTPDSPNQICIVFRTFDLTMNSNLKGSNL